MGSFFAVFCKSDVAFLHTFAEYNKHNIRWEELHSYVKV